jgi:hypothetical protein
MEDIVKVRLQSRPDLYPGAIAAAKSIWRDEGPLAFYKVIRFGMVLISGYFGSLDWNRWMCRSSILAIP